MTIRNAQAELHDGVYQCIVKSPLGVAYSVAILSVVDESDVVIETRERDSQHVPYEHMQGTDPQSHSNGIFVKRFLSFLLMVTVA